MLGILDVLQRTEGYFAERGVPQPRLQAELLLSHLLGLKRLDLYVQHDRPLGKKELDTLRGWVKRRAAREPLQHLVGETDFADLTLACDRRALIPRPETEELYEHVMALLNRPPGAILDIGTGTGALALAFAKQYPGAAVTATDVSPEALSLARENAERNGLADRIQFMETNLFDSVEGASDLIVSNPPYLTEEEFASAEPEVREHEPKLALVAGEEGLAVLRAILEQAPHYLAAGGWLALETGVAHHECLKPMASGYSEVRCLPDLRGRPRFVLCRR